MEDAERENARLKQDVDMSERTLTEYSISIINESE